MKVFISYKIPRSGIELLEKNGLEVTFHKGKKLLDGKSLIKKAKNADALISLLSDKIDKYVIDSLPKLKIIANFAVGFNNIDIEYAASKGIVVTNTPGILTAATADLTMALLLCAARRINEAERFLKEGKFDGWKPELLTGMELDGKKLGIVGMGRIGIAVAQRAHCFGLKIQYYSRTAKPKAEEKFDAKRVSLNKLLKTSDIISLHAPLTPETQNLLNKEKLDLLKPEAILINTARGEIVDEDYLIELLKLKKIRAAGIDVYANEPDINKKWFSLENVVLLPHIGSATEETRNKMALLAAKNVISTLLNGKPITPVN